ncbi:MAG: DUF3987 domain-containing protein [bacterium]|nr:DUF3987 domain-containing protein [bacterium]
MSELTKAAEHYASKGWKIFPCVPGKKNPMTEHGVKDATSDLAQIYAWWGKWPNANIGLACGPGSGVYAIDIDFEDERDIDGYASMKEFPPLPGTVTAKTPRGGLHVLYKTDDPPRNATKFRPGVEIKSDGTYIVIAPSIHPNGKAYEWLDERAPWEVKLTEFPDFMRPATWPTVTTTRPSPPQPAPAPVQPPASKETLERASTYLATCEPAVQGQGGHSALFTAATAMVWGFGLTNEQAVILLANEYNPRCNPPWDLRVTADGNDFFRKVTQVREKPPNKPYCWLKDDPAFQAGDVDTSMLDIDSFIAEAASAKEEEAPEPKGDLAVIVKKEAPHSNYALLANPPGLLGVLCDWINDTALCRQPMLSLACSLSFLGTLFGRKVADIDGLRTNVYCMGIAGSSAGKQHPINKISDLCRDAGIGDLIGGTDIGSDSGLEELVSKKPASLLLLDEIGFLLTAIGAKKDSYSAKVISTLMKLYSSAGNTYFGRVYADQDNVRTIVQPCLSIYGTSSILRFAEGLDPREIDDGWLGRCLMFTAMDAEKNRDKKLPTSAPPTEDVVKLVQKWFTRRPGVDENGENSEFGKFAVFHSQTGAVQEVPPEQIIVPASKEANEIFIALDNKANRVAKRDQKVGCLWKKAEENARRLALIVACGESYDEPTITAGNANYACKLVEYLLNGFEKTVLPFIVSSQLEARKQKIIAMSEKGGVNGVRHRTLMHNTKYYNQRERDAVIADLAEAGDIVKVSVGRTFYYFTPENYAKYLKESSKDD